jgi:GTPase SAR1 family protein
MMKKANNEIYNFYQNKEIQKLIPQYNNPHFEDVQMSHPFRACIVGGSGTGKTSVLLNIIHKMPDTFNHIIVVHKMSEPLYEFLEKKIGDKNITFYKKLSELPLPEKLEKKTQQLLIFDDMVADGDKSHEIVKQYAIRCRKIGQGISMCYLSQDYHRIPKMIRLQFSHILLLKLGSMNDLDIIMRNYSLGIDKEMLRAIYKDATKEKFNFLKIDVNNPDMNKKFSKNFNDFYQLENEDDG